MAIFHYGDVELDHLRRQDRRLGRAIEEIGMIRREVTPDLFTALIFSIAGQQISAKAAATVCERLGARFRPFDPATLAAATTGEIRECGLSERKAGYISGIAAAASGGNLDLTGLRTLSDDEVIARLSSLHGVGRWTAEMLLIFSLERPDVVSWDDRAIRRGMMNLYGHTTLSREQFGRHRRRYAPFGSVASLYLWAVSHR